MTLAVRVPKTPAGTAVASESALGATVKVAASGAKSLLSAGYDNTANAAASWLKLYAHASPPLHATDPDLAQKPYYVIKVPASKHIAVTCTSADAEIPTAVGFGAFTTPGSTGTTSPSTPGRGTVALY